MAQVFLFTGQNAFALREEKKAWKDRFIEKHGDTNLSVLDGAGLTLRVLLDEVSVAPFAAEKRLVMVEGIPKFSKEDIESLDHVMHPDCVLAFWDPKPDKRLAGTKALLAAATVREFAPLTGHPLRQWVRSTSSLLGTPLEDAAIGLLLDIVGEDQDMLWQEIQKLSIARPMSAVSAADVRALAVPSGEQEVWHLSNLLAEGRTAEALHYARGLLQRGEDPHSLWSILLWVLRSLVAVHAAAADGNTQPARVATAAGVPFPTARTLLPLGGSVPFPKLRSLHSWAVAADIALKTGGYRSSGDAQQELLALIDRLIVRFGELKV